MTIGCLAAAASTAGAQPAMAPAAQPQELEQWPLAIADRPTTLDASMVELRAALSVFGFSDTGSSSDTFSLAGVGASFGISNQVEIGGDYAFQMSPSTDAAGELAGHIQFRLAHGGPLSASLGASVLYSHSADGIIVTGGLNVRYRLSPAVSLYTMTSGVPVCGGCLKVLGPVTGQFVFAIPNHGDTEAFVNLPVGLGIQAAPQLYLYGETSLATFELSPSTDSISTFSDYVGVNVGGWFTASKQFEIGASVADDLKHSGDIFLVELSARVHL